MRKLTANEVFYNDTIMAMNAKMQLGMDDLMVLIDAVTDALDEINQQDKLDAARYRWLREEDNDELVLKSIDLIPRYWYLPRLERLDAAIDAYTKDVQDETAKPKY